MNWTILDNINQLDDVRTTSENKPVVIFKHSTRCIVSKMAKNRFEEDWDFKADQVQPYFLDLLQNRPISNKIAEIFNVQHQSPQLLLIKNGECTYHTSHSDISAAALKEAL